MATKPTVNQYNRVFGQFIQYSIPNYELLRTWILDGGSGGQFESVTYAELVALIGSSGLTAGNWYKITDYAVLQDIPNGGGAQRQGLAETLIVRALTANTIGEQAVSESHPSDIIIYDYSNTDFGADTGRIMYRKDTIRNITAWYDWRNFVFRRWDDGSGVFNVVTDNGNASQDTVNFTDFLGTPANNIIEYPRYASNGAQVQSNNMVYAGAQNIEIKPYAYENTLQQRCNGVTLDYEARNNAIGSLMSDIFVGYDSQNNLIGDANGARIQIGADNSGIDIIGSSSDIEIGNGNDTASLEASNLKIGNYNENLTINLGSGNVVIGNENTDCIIGENCVNIVYGNLNDALELLDGCSRVKFGNNNTGQWTGVDCNFMDSNALTFSGDVAQSWNVGSSNTITVSGDGSTNVIIGNSNTEITFAGDDINGVSIGSDNASIAINGEVTNTTIGNGNVGIIFADDADAITILDGITNARTIAAGERGRVDGRTFTKWRTPYDFANGGTVGTYAMANIPDGCTIIDAKIKAANMVSAGAATIALGVATDSAAGILAATAYNDASFNGDLIESICKNDTGSSWIEATADRTFLVTVAGAEITAGNVVIYAEGRY